MGNHSQIFIQKDTILKNEIFINTLGDNKHSLFGDFILESERVINHKQYLNISY